MNKLFSVDELAREGETTPRAVRLYVDKGLLQPMRIGRILCFTEEAKLALKHIKRFKRLGFSLNEIKACQSARDTAIMKSAIKRIEQLISDANDEVSDLRRRLANKSKKEITQ